MEDGFGALVKRARRTQGWTQRDLARRMGVGQQAVSSWERGAARPVNDDLDRLAGELAVDAALLREAASPSETVVTPPVRPLLVKLPLHELRPETFEQFSADLASALHAGSQVNRQGGQGHTQHGVDILVRHPDGTTDAIQCKREQQFGPAKIAEAVRKLTADVAHCQIFLSRVASPQARAEIAKHASWSLWDADNLSSAVRSLPDRDTAVRLIDTYFPGGWRESFLGVAAPGSWLTAEEFFRPYSQEGIYSHTWQLVGRDVELAGLSNWVAGSGSSGPVASLLGRGGIGKTRLLRALAHEITSRGCTVRFLSTNATIDSRDFDLLPPDDDLLVIVDDAHDRIDITAIVSGIRRFRPKAKVLLSLRPYARAALHSELRRLGVHPTEVPTYELADLTVSEAEALARAILGPGAAVLVVRRLAAVAPDCPLLIVVGASLISRGVLDPGSLETSEHIREEILSAFGDVLAGAPQAADAELRREMLDTIAALQPFRLDQPDFQQAASIMTGRPFDQILPHIRALQDAGALLRRGESVRIVPDLLGDVLLSRAAVEGASGFSTGYLERVCRAIAGGPLRHAVVNASRVDWQTHSRGGRGSAVAVLWEALGDAFESGTDNERLQILEAVRQVAVFQPDHAMALVDKALRLMADEVDDARTPIRLVRSIPGILHRVALNHDHLADAIDGLWRMARWDTRPPHQHPDHPMRVLTDLAEYGENKPVDVQYAMIAAAQRWLREDDVAEHPYSPFTALEPILATEGEDRLTDGFAMVLRPMVVVADVVRPVRDRVVDLAFTEVRAVDVGRAVHGVQALEAATRYPLGMFGRVPDDAEYASWTHGFVTVLERLADLVVEPDLDPVVVVAVRKAVEWHARYSSGDTNQAAQAVLATLPDGVDHRLAHVLHDGWGASLPDMDEYEEYRQRQLDHFVELAVDLCEGRQADEVADHLLRRLAVERQAYGDGATSPTPFVWRLVRNHSDVGFALVNRAISVAVMHPDLVAAVLSALVEAVPGQAAFLVRALVDSAAVEHVRAVAHALSWGRGNRAELFDGEADLLRALLAHDDPSVRRLAVSAARTLKSDHRDLARELLTNARFADSTALAGEVAAILTTPGDLSWEHLTDTDMRNFFEQLRTCPSLNEHHITRLLAEMSAVHPDEVLKLLIRRVETAEVSDLSDFEPLPFQWSRPLRLNESTMFAHYLRHVLDWIAENPKSWLRTGPGSKIFAAVAVRYDDLVVEVLSDAMRSGDRALLHAVASVLREASRNFAWTREVFVVEALRIAERHDEESIQAVGGALHAAAMRGTRIGTPGEPFQEDVDQRDNARTVAAGLSVGSIEHRFYSSLAEAAESQIRWHLDRDDQLHDQRSW